MLPWNGLVPHTPGCCLFFPPPFFPLPQGGLSSYSQTTLVHIYECVNGEMQKRRLEKKIIINSRSYAYAAAYLADPDRNKLTQHRYCFLWEGVRLRRAWMCVPCLF